MITELNNYHHIESQKFRKIKVMEKYPLPTPLNEHTHINWVLLAISYHSLIRCYLHFTPNVLFFD